MTNMTKILALCGAATLLVAQPASAQQSAAAATSAPEAPSADWIERSNAYTMQLAMVDAKFMPEYASATGYEQYDGKTFDISKNSDLAKLAAYKDLRKKFADALGSEKDMHVKQDLQILIDSLDLNIEQIELGRKLTIDWYNMPETIFGSITNLLDDQIAPERRVKAVELLRRYTGVSPDTEAYTEQAKARFRESMGEGKVGPYDVEVRESVEKFPVYAKGIRDLFERYDIEGADEALAAMDRQFADYGKWTTETVLPVARSNPQLPPELYALRLRDVGIDIPPETAAAQARAGFYELRQQIDILSKDVAQKFGFEKTDYLSVLAALKKQKIDDAKIEDYYRGINRQIEAKMKAAGIADVPASELKMRLATPAEEANQPAPHMLPPRLVGNTGEQGTFVLTKGDSSAGEDAAYNDFNFPAAAWTLSAHEARPGHEMQFAALVDQGVSLARLLYAFNSVNVEGWALYAEAEMLPEEPVEGQLIATQFRLLRAARAFLDPMLNLGQIDRSEGERILREEAGFSAPMAKQELDRYTFRMPGQAGAYYYGYRQLINLRVEAETRLGDKFDRKAFNNFLLSQGIIPLNLIAKAVREDFIPAQLAK